MYRGGEGQDRRRKCRQSLPSRLSQGGRWTTSFEWGPKMPGYRVISSDSHVMEPADLWTSRVEPKFRDRAPHIVCEEDRDWWCCDDQMVVPLSLGTKAGVRFEDPGNLSHGGKYEEVPLGGYIPDEHVKDLDADGVYAGLVYPSVGFLLYPAVPDSELLTALFRTYNDWVAEFCKNRTLTGSSASHCSTWTKWRSA